LPIPYHEVDGCILRYTIKSLSNLKSIGLASSCYNVESCEIYDVENKTIVKGEISTTESVEYTFANGKTYEVTIVYKKGAQDALENILYL
jgi:hypothetical protein